MQHKIMCTSRYRADMALWGAITKNLKLLQMGKEYTLVKTSVHDFYTKYYLSEFPGVPFNSVWFDDRR